MSDRIAVMNQGRIEQLGTPDDIFEQPQTRFVAEFMGMTNFFDGRIVAFDGGLVRIEGSDGTALYGRWSGNAAPRLGEHAFLAVHPERLHVELAPDSTLPINAIAGKVIGASYRGAQTDLTVETALGRMVASLTFCKLNNGDDATLLWRADECALGPSSRPPSA
jgi:spermidine/putrescine transport system ATP-binding protein